jgi:cytochrome c-type biogenesis protein CcmF
MLIVGAAGAAVVALVAVGTRRLGLARWFLGAAAGLAGSALLLLAVAMWRVDTSLVEVATTTSRATAGPLRLAGLWGGPAGSLLCFTAVVAAVAAVAGRRLPAAGMAALAAPVAVLLTLVAVAGPFRLAALAPLDGTGLVPVLRRTSMLVHPPVIYAGLALVLVPAAVAVADLAGRASDDHRRLGRQVALVAWSLLAVGMVLGSRWAHREVGWGGVWAWDPVEDAALLPWLALTAGLHVRSPRAWWVGAGLLAWAGTWATRSGRLESVHAFSGQGAVGAGLGLALVGFVAAVVVTALRCRRRSSGGGPAWPMPAPVPMLVVGAVVWVGAGTAWALLGGGDRTVAASFYVALVAPLAIAALALLGRGLPPVELAAAAAAGALGAAGLAITGNGSIAVLAVALVAPAAVTGAIARSSSLGATLAHLGLVLLVAGAVVSAAGQEGTARLAVGDERRVAGLDVRLAGLEGVAHRDRKGVQARLEVGGRRLAPALVEVEQLGPRADVATSSTWRREVQAVLVSTDGGGSAVVSVSTTPGAMWVWAGGLLLAAGGLTEALSRRRRTRPSDAAAQAPASEGAARPVG